MATAKYGVRTERDKHLRPWGRRNFWHRVRQKFNKGINNAQREKGD